MRDDFGAPALLAEQPFEQIGGADRLVMAERETQLRDARPRSRRRDKPRADGRSPAYVDAMSSRQQARQCGRGRLGRCSPARALIGDMFLGHLALQVSHLVRQAALANSSAASMLDRHGSCRARQSLRHQERVGQTTPAHLLEELPAARCVLLGFPALSATAPFCRPAGCPMPASTASRGWAADAAARQSVDKQVDDLELGQIAAKRMPRTLRHSRSVISLTALRLSRLPAFCARQTRPRYRASKAQRAYMLHRQVLELLGTAPHRPRECASETARCGRRSAARCTRSPPSRAVHGALADSRCDIRRRAWRRGRSNRAPQRPGPRASNASSMISRAASRTSS